LVVPFCSRRLSVANLARAGFGDSANRLLLAYPGTDGEARIMPPTLSLSN